MNRVIVVGLTVIALVGAPAAMAAPQSRYIDEQRLDADAIRDVNTIALLELPDPEAYYYAGGKPGAASMLLGVIGTIAEVAEMGKNADQYPGADFPQSLQAYLRQFLSENNYRIVDHAIERKDRFDLLDDYSSLEVTGADAYLDVALVEIGYLYEPDLVGAEIKPVATAIVRLVSAETLQVIYARTFQFGDQVNIHSQSEHILPPDSHVYESKDDIDVDKPRAIERLDRALEVVAFNIARSITSGKFVSTLSPTMEDVASAEGDQATVEFLGVAATEVAMKTYDEKLWQQSGELAGGDAKKQAEIYIKLRSKQLAEEERRGKSKQLAKLSDSMFEISGTYVSDITSENHWVFNKKKHRRITVVLEQDGENITGLSKSVNLKITGTLEGDTVTYFTWPSDVTNSEIKGKWIIDVEGNKLVGKWTHPLGGGNWDLIRTDSAPIARLNTPTPTAVAKNQSSNIVDLTGTYVSDITTNNQWRFRKAEDRRLKIIISQNGNEITGTNKSKNLKISGVIEGDEISFFTWPSDISSDEIKGKWKINPDGMKLTGKWLHPHGGGKWNLTRVE